MSDYAIQVKQILRENQCWKIRSGKGDHDIWFSPHSRRNFTVDGTIKSRHTANEILKQAGLGKRF